MVSQANVAPKTNNPVPFHPHHIRTFFAAIFGILALFLITTSILVVWINQTLTNQQVFVNTLAPLAAKPAIQNYIAEKVTTDILQNTPTTDMADALLPKSEVLTSTTQQLQTDLKPVINQSVLQVVQSQEFYTLWKNTLESSHQSFLSQLDSNASNITLNLHPTVVGVINQLQATNLQSISNKVQIQSNVGILNIKGNIIKTIRSSYNLFKKATIGVVILTIIFISICVYLSIHHYKTLRRIVLGTGIICLVIAIALKVPSLLTKSSDSLQQNATFAVINTLFHNLQLITLIAGIVLVLGAIFSKIYPKFHKKANKSVTPKVAPAA